MLPVLVLVKRTIVQKKDSINRKYIIKTIEKYNIFLSFFAYL